MSRKEKAINNYIAIVDYYKPFRMKRNTWGRYRVGAKTKEEATEILRSVIGFGDITIVYTCIEEVDKKKGIFIGYKEVYKEEIHPKDGKWYLCLIKPHHATDPVSSYADNSNNPVKIIEQK